MNILCNGFPWWILLGTILAVILIILILALDWMGIRTALTTNRRFPRPCTLAGLLMAIYLAFLLMAILNQFLPVLCRPSEAIYIWRLKSALSSDILYMPSDGSRAPVSFSELNRKSICVGCHTVSNTGKLIAAVTQNANGKIVVMGLDGTTRDIPSINGSYLSFSPDGTRLAFSANDQDISILDIASQTVTPLTGASDPNLVETMPAWSADGKTIAFVRPVSGADGFIITVPSDIYTIPVTGGVATILPGASGDGFNYYPVYSPDGRWLAFTRHTTGNTTYSADQAEIFIVPAQGGKSVRIAANDNPTGSLKNVSNTWVSWSPDGQYLAFSSKRNNGQYDIFTTVIDDSGNSGPAELLKGASEPDALEHLPAWGEPPFPNVLLNILNLWPWLIPLLLLFLLMLLACKRTPPLPATLELKRTISPDQGRLKQDLFTTRLDLVGNTSPCEGNVDVKPVDVAMAIDISGSMSGQPLADAKNAAILFLNKLEIGQDQVAIIPFDDNASVAHDLDGDKPKILAAVNGLSSAGGTAIDQGLKEALRVITGTEKRVEAEPVIILLSDGGSAHDPAKIEADKIKDEGIRLICIGFGGGADSALLSEMASSPADYYSAPDGEKLKEIYRSIAETMHKPVAATNIEVTHYLDDENFKILPESIFPPPKSFDGSRKIVWFFDHIGTTHRIMKYKVKPLHPGEFNVDKGDSISYLRCGRDLSQLDYGEELKVKVIEKIGVDRLPTRRPPVLVRELTKPEIIWQPTDALMIGIGGVGRRILTHVKKNLQDSGAGIAPDNIKLLVFDTSEHEQVKGQNRDVEFGGVTLNKDEVYVLDESLVKQQKAFNTNTGQERADFPWFPYQDYSGRQDEFFQLKNGTNGERPLVRMGLQLALSKLRESLKESLRKVRITDPDGSYKIHIIITGSLSGAMSGLLIDIAHLIQVLAKEEFETSENPDQEISVIVEGYLVLDSGLPEDWPNPNERKANSFATLRELSRFQVNPGYPFQMGYPSDPAHNLSDHQLFKRLNMFDNGTMKLDIQSLVASIADQISLRLDKTSGAAGPGDWMNGLDDNISGAQQAKRQAVVRSAGCFTFRLPVNDIMRQVEKKWLSALLTCFLGDEKTIEVQEEFYKNHPAEFLALQFLSDPSGLLGKDEENPDLKVLRVFHELVADERSGEDLSVLMAVVERQNDKIFERALINELHAVSETVLSGSSDDLDVSRTRIGKISYWRKFLEALQFNLKKVDVVLQKPGSDFSPNQVSRLKQLNSVALEKIKLERDQFNQVASLICSKRFGVQDELQDGLVETIDKSIKNYEAYQTKTNEISVRKYAWTMKTSDVDQLDFADYIYTNYAQGERHPGKYLDLLEWVTDPEKGTGLLLKVKTLDGKEGYTFFGNEDYPSFEHALFDLARSVFADSAWKDPKLSLLKSWLPADFPMKIQANSKCLLAHDNLGVVKNHRVMGIEENREKFNDLLVDPFLKGGGEAQRIKSDITDKYALSFLQTEEVILLSDIGTILKGSDSLENVYMTDAANAKKRAVFREENEAVQIETEILRMNSNASFILHPMVVAGLMDMQRAEWFALAYAYGWIHYDPNSISITIGGQNHLLIDGKRPNIDILVDAFLKFVYGEPKGVDLPAIPIPDAITVEKWRKTWQTIPNEFGISNSSEKESLGKLFRYFINRKSVEIRKEYNY